ncbi:hypothetical protein K438DRAFT_1672911, partial [Mycena galopus ATCC 62051]
MTDTDHNAGPSNTNNSGPPLTMEQQMGNMQAQMALMLSSLQLLQAGQPAPAAGQPPPPPLVLPAQLPPPVQPQFVPPIAPLNSPAGTSPSLRSFFPHVKPACITSVISHDFEASDLYKLDKRVKDTAPAYNFNAAGVLEMNASKNKTYKVLNSVTLPLHIYFAILGAHLAAKSVAPTYEWPAVLEYHTLFFNQRQEEMQAGVYTHWGSPDPDLLCVHVYPHKKA